MIVIVPINKEEKRILSERFPKATFVRTMRQDSKRGHYYCTEERSLLRCLEEIRGSKVIEEHGSTPSWKKNKKQDGNNSSWKKDRNKSDWNMRRT